MRNLFNYNHVRVTEDSMKRIENCQIKTDVVSLMEKYHQFNEGVLSIVDNDTELWNYFDLNNMVFEVYFIENINKPVLKYVIDKESGTINFIDMDKSMFCDEIFVFAMITYIRIVSALNYFFNHDCFDDEEIEMTCMYRL